MTNIQEINISDIKVNDRKRAVSDVKELIESINNAGLINPITVNKDMTLISGLHRLEAFKELKKETIPAIIVNVDKMKAELIEIDENIIRKNLSVLEESEQLKRRKEIYESLHPETTAKAIKKNNLTKRQDVVSDEKTFVEDTAEKTGLSERTIQRKLKPAKDITPESKEMIKGTPIENNQKQLLEIAKTETEKQAELIKKLIAEGDKKDRENIKKALKEMDKTEKATQLKLDFLEPEYKVDFRLRVVVVNNKWLELPPEYDMDNNSYNNMVLVAKNYKKTKKEV